MATNEATYDEAQIAEKLKALPGWYLEDGWIRRVYKTDGWPTTLMLVNAIGYLSEAAYHHPDLSVTWGRITVKLSTHSAGGITDKDFALARKIEDVVLSKARRTSGCAAAIPGESRVPTRALRDRDARGTGVEARGRRARPARRC
jgi:4a-hydroxytetrahydrobiopterin dehydratase